MGEVKKFWADLCVHHIEAVRYSDYATLEAENAKLRAELGQMVVPDDLLARCADWCDGNPKQPWYGRTAGDMVRTFMACQPLCTPSAPKADDPVKVQLLEALESAADALARAEFFEQADNARAAISAVREEVMK